MFRSSSASKRSAERRLTEPLALEDGRPPRVTSMTLYALSGFVLAAIGWAAITEVREIAVAPGHIAHTGTLHAVQHLEGGIVAELFVREGDVIEAGAPIARLQPVQASSERDQLAVRAAGLALQVIRLEAQVRGTLLDFGPLAAAHPAAARDQLAVFASETTLRRREAETLEARRAQRIAESTAAAAEVSAARAQADIAREQLRIQERLMREGYTSRRALLEAQAASARAQADLASAQGRLGTTREALREAETQVAEAAATYAKRIADERAKAAAELAETEAQIARTVDRVDRLIVRAATGGVVQELVPRGPGEVVRPGDTLARIVPVGADIVAEVRIDPKDIGHVRVGSRAEVKVTTFDTTVYGSIDGEILRISPTTFTAGAGGSPPEPGVQPGQPFYRATVRLSRVTVGEGRFRRALAPGMQVQAEVISGEKSIVRYMLKPVFRSLDQAFTER